MANDEKNIEVENYEHNLKLHYEAKRKELDILLSNSIPNQLSNMKTILWINFLSIGLILQFIKKFPLSDVIIGFFVLSLCAIFTVLIAMLSNRTKSYGVNDDIKMMSIYEDNQWPKSQAIFDMLYAVQLSILDNRNVIINRAKLMHIATYLTASSLFFIIYAFVLKQLT